MIETNSRPTGMQLKEGRSVCIITYRYDIVASVIDYCPEERGES